MAEQQRPRGAFPTTRITLIEAACGEPGSEARQALSIICDAYWYPIYAYIRRLGYAQPDAEDLTQGFLTRLMETHALRDFHRERGRFRSYLLGALKHFVANERDWARAQKRGGGAAPAPFEDLLRTAEHRYSTEPRDDVTPERVFERQWAIALLSQVEDRLRREVARTGKEAMFERLKACLVPGDANIGYRALATELDTTEGAIKVTVHRWRQRFGELLRDEIARTVARPEDIGDELRYLMAAIRP